MHITLKTLPDATAQQVFDQAANHLAQQRKRQLAKEYELDESAVDAMESNWPEGE